MEEHMPIAIIAMSFATWISPEFQLYIMKDYRRLKTDENSRFSLNWNLNREISKLNYKIHTDVIKDNLISPELTPAQVAYTYANEADMLNVVLFGKTAKQWKDENLTLKVNMRDVATLNQLLVLVNLESYNAVLINQGKSQKERMELLRQLAVQQLQTLETVRYNLFWDNTPFCTMLFIDEDYQGKGFGMLLTSTQVNEEAQHFYIKLGYKDCGGFVIDVAGYEQPMELFLIKSI